MLRGRRARSKATRLFCQAGWLRSQGAPIAKKVQRRRMSYRRTEARTAYIEWAKLHAGAKYNLAASGVKGVPLSELPVRLQELELSAGGSYGYGPLLERLAARYGVAA